MTAQVIKRNGRKEKISFDKISKRINTLCKELHLDRINVFEIAKETINGLFNGITTEEIDHFAVINCSEKISEDTQYDKLATGLCISRLHKTTNRNFFEVTEVLFNDTRVTKEYFEFVKINKEVLQKVLDENYIKDYDFDFFGFKTLERSYLHKKNEKGVASVIIERPQHLFMRVAIALGINGKIEDVIETYYGLSDRKFIFGSPTLYNSGSKWCQMSSCFLLNMDDNLESIMDTTKEIGLISKRAGGIGVCASNIRASGSIIRGTNGASSGIVPLIQVLNWVGRYINQGGKRNGAIAIYLEPWHADIFHFCELRSNKGKEEERARDIFLALWICDLFMKRVETDDIWSLMCPDECPGLTTTYGEEFEKLYIKYEAEKKFKKQVRAKDLWFHILQSQIENGMPYMLYKDSINRKSNQKNLGVIQCSNLCSEIVQFTSANESAVCNLASLCLPRFVKTDKKGDKYYDFEELKNTAGLVVKNLNNIIDINFYPTEKAKMSNLKHRPIGLGVQGLADVFCMLDIPFDSGDARLLNKKIFETIYFGAVSMSMELAKEKGQYSSFDGSPMSKGLLQFHLWNESEDDLIMDYPWDTLIEDVKKYGVRNSLLTTIMPTASTSQIMGNTESIEPLATNVYTRTTLAGEFTVVNKYLIEKLISLKLWNENIRNELLYDKGSVQKIKEIPDEIKAVYKTAYEMRNKPIVQQSIDRGPFIDQSQSLNLFCQIPDFDMLTSSHFYTWRNGLKTGLYYLKTQPAVSAIDFGLDAEVINNIEEKRGNGKNKKGKGLKEKFNVNIPCGESCGA